MNSLLSTSSPSDRLRLPAALEASLLAEAPEAEAAGRLTERQLEIIHDAGWFRMFVPRECGGLQLPLPEALLLEESLAAVDGSLGWTVTLCSGAGLFAGFVQAGLRDLMFRDPRLCIGGSGAPSGTAERVAAGWRVSGHWHFATGTPHLTAFSTNCRIMENGRPITDAEGNEQIRSFLFLPEEVSPRDDWNVMGLRATASRSFRIDDLVVPENRSFLIRPEAATLADPVYRYPFLQFAELTLAANFGGMGLAFLDCFGQSLDAHGGTGARKHLRAEALHAAAGDLELLRSKFHGAAAASWTAMNESQGIPGAMLQELSAASRGLAAGVRHMVTELYPYAGLVAADPRTRINRIWRDLFTATQHSLLTYPA